MMTDLENNVLDKVDIFFILSSMACMNIKMRFLVLLITLWRIRRGCTRGLRPKPSVYRHF